MSKRISFFNLSIKKILSEDQSILNKARIRLIYYGLLLAFLGLLAVIPNVYSEQARMQTNLSVLLLVCLLGLFKYFTYRPDFEAVSHALLVLGSFLVLTVVYVVFQDVNIIVIQLVILIILFGYYMLGLKWGTIYSLINVAPILIYLVWVDANHFLTHLRPEKLDGYTVTVVMFFNFILIIFIQGHFYGAFLKNIEQLKDFANSEKQLNEKLGYAMQRLEKSSQVQSEFLSTMSHEIRTPLNAVIGMSNLLLMEGPRPDQKENLEILRFSAGNLLTLVNDVLDFNKIESGKITFENIKFNLDELMQNICGGQMMKAHEKGLGFKLDIDEYVQNRYLIGDPTRLSQIIFNLITNAIKFTTRGGVAVTVECVEDRHNEATIRFAIRDSGIGIAQDKIVSIFEPFTQESITTTRQFGGTGLGLSIVKRLLDLKGGSIEVTSEIGVGSEFSVLLEFPVSTDVMATEEKIKKLAVPENKEKSRGGNDFQISNLQVLIAEDNAVNVMLMKKLFSKWGITPVIAENGERAIELLQYGNFDVILMDLQMPVLDGLEATKIIRKMPDSKKANIPIIALTASALFDVKDKVYNSGMNDYVSKPFKPNELLEKILSLVGVD
ncbi:signal transduction histidine kinase [Mucilaginibacter gracilis]|uniref:histidine kinase n=1 Tax=Mucilaginibacter gracilis TaxID=423350 RepID=A0A495J3N3_9SPHI|nr:ATP-binding protein [Mucilaginibacter gracilis]RKR82619.1 signal transduction histidine kinase [Mucilaginibacter gracilis]